MKLCMHLKAITSPLSLRSSRRIGASPISTAGGLGLVTGHPSSSFRAGHKGPRGFAYAVVNSVC